MRNRGASRSVYVFFGNFLKIQTVANKSLPFSKFKDLEYIMKPEAIINIFEICIEPTTGTYNVSNLQIMSYLFVLLGSAHDFF